VVAALLPYKDRLEKVSVDVVGIGYYMAQHLRDQGLRVEEVNVGERARDSEKYANLKAELYWGLRERLQAGDLAGLTDEKAIAQLAGIRYSHNARGQVVIESKEEARKRGVKSPDRAEAIMLAFAEQELVLGLIECMLAEQAEITRRQAARMEARKEPKPACPLCQSTIVAPVAGEWRCNQCGHQFGRPVVPVPKLPDRYELLEARGGLSHW
jgi:hypothetical protein